MSNFLWWNGLPFLQRPEEEWPELSIKKEIDEGAEVEMVKHAKQVTRVLVGTEDPQIRDIAAVVDCQRFCSKVRLVRVTAYVIRFINRLKSMVKRTSEQSLNSVPQHNSLSADEIVNAENMWIRYVQELNFMEELRYLRNESKTSPPPNIRNLGLCVDDDGLLKCKGRLNNAPICETEKRPILLPSKHVGYHQF